MWQESHPCPAPDSGKGCWNWRGPRCFALPSVNDWASCNATATFGSTTKMASMVIYASYQDFTFTVFRGGYCLCQLLAPLYPLLATPSLPPSACQREQALSPWEVHPPSSACPVVFGDQCCVARFGLHCRQLKWRFVSIWVQTGFLFLTIEGGQAKTLWHRACFAGPGRWNWACHTSSVSHLILIKNCDLTLCICRNWIQKKCQV